MKRARHSKLLVFPSICAIHLSLLGFMGCARGGGPQTAPVTPATPVDAEGQPMVFGKAAPPMATPAVLPGMPDVASLAEKVRPMVVNITARGKQQGSRVIDPFEFFFGPGHRPPGLRPHQPFGNMPRRSLGSGFVVDPAGYIITNNHVVADSEDISVRFSDDRSYDAEVVGRDPKLDIALLKLKGTNKLPTVVLGNSEVLRVGEYVVAVGNPFGLGHTVTLGIVSAKDRTIGAGPYDDFIQTDASINPGNSGGPLFNLRGEVVGVNTAIHAQGQGIGFTIPINMVRDVLPQLRSVGHVTRGKLGIVFQPVTEELAKAMGLPRARGALVSEVEPGGPAAKAGIQPGDLILKVDKSPVTQGSDLPRLIARNAPGTKVAIGYRRKGTDRRAVVTLERLDDDKSSGKRTPGTKPGSPGGTGSFGLRMTPATGGGVLINQVQGPLAAKLQRRDVILEVDGRPMASANQVTAALQRASTRKRPALVRLKRRNRTMFVAVKVKP